MHTSVWHLCRSRGLLCAHGRLAWTGCGTPVGSGPVDTGSDHARYLRRHQDHHFL